MLLGLVPLLWFRPGFQLASEDMDAFFDATHWRLLWFSWNSQYNAGVNYSHTLAAQGFHAIPAVLNGLGLRVAAIQKIQSVLWFTLQGLGMAYLMNRVVRARHRVVATWVAVSFYMFNLYQENVWLSMDIAKLSAYTALPFMLAEFLRMLDRDISLRRAIVGIAGYSLLGAGMGTNPPLVLVVVGAFVIALLAYLWGHQCWRRGAEGWRVVRATLVIGIVVIACHAFWILPMVNLIRHDLPTNAADLSQDWLAGVSANTSLANVCRLQGDWTWYDGWQEPYRPYAALYRTHWGLIGLSWLIPCLVLIGILCARNRHKFCFFLLTLLGLMLSMGQHPPMGTVYQWLTAHIPLFWTFRSPWYKFTLWTCMGYAVFIGLAASEIYERVRRIGGRWRTIAAMSTVGGLMAANLAYAFPVTLGKMYTTAEERKFLPPNYVRIPPHVWETARWVNEQFARGFFRVLVLPESESWTYQWGLGSPSPVLLPMSVAPVLFPMHVAGVAPEQPLLRLFYHGLYHRQSSRLVQLLRLLNVRYLLHETDVKYWIPAGDTDDPPFIRAALAPQQGITRGSTFGPWEMYEVPPPLPHAYYLPTATLVVGDLRALVPLTATDLLTTPAVVTTADISSSILNTLLTTKAIDSVVITPDQPLVARLPSTMPMYLVAATDQLPRQVDSSVAQPLTPWLGFGQPESFAEKPWRPLESNNAPNWTLNNFGTVSCVWQIEGTVRSPAKNRDLYAYVDGSLLAIHHVTADTPTHLQLALTIPPGEHHLAWYSPDIRTTLPDGRQVGFFFATDWCQGPPIRRGTLTIPKTGAYHVRIVAGQPTCGGPPPMTRFDQQLITWTSEPSAPATWMATVALTAGTSEVSFSEAGDQPYTMVLTPSAQPPLAPRPLTPLPWLAGTAPTQGPSARLPGPGWLIFSEAYHPDWTLTGAPAAHVQINGFANGYYLAQPPGGPVTVTFTPQRWVWVGLACSGLTLLGLGWVVVRR